MENNPIVVASIESLGTDELLEVFSFLNYQDLVVCTKVSLPNFYNCANEERLYQDLAYRRYGKTLTKSTLRLYNHSYRAMLADDNSEGAIPTLLQLKKQQQQQQSQNSMDGGESNNQQQQPLCCRIPCVQWHHKENTLIVNIEVVGDLLSQQPNAMNSIVCRSHNAIRSTSRPSHSSSTLMERFFFDRTTTTSSSRRSQDERRINYFRLVTVHWHCEPHPNGKRYFQGAVTFHDDNFRTPGTYYFTARYQDPTTGRSHVVVEFPLFTIKPNENGLSQAALERPAITEEETVAAAGTAAVSRGVGQRRGWRDVYFTSSPLPLTRSTRTMEENIARLYQHRSGRLCDNEVEQELTWSQPSSEFVESRATRSMFDLVGV